MRGTTSEISDIAADISTGYGTERSIAFLADGTVQIRLILLQKLLADVAAHHTADAAAAGLHDAFEMLSALQRENPDKVVELLRYPHTGPWLAGVRRRIDGAASTSGPLWPDLAYLGWLAAAGSVATHDSGTVDLVVRHGIVMLPGIGRAQLLSTEDHGHCTLRWSVDGALHFTVESHTVDVPSSEAENHEQWRPLRKLPTTNGQAPAFLDDLDPFRDFTDSALRPNDPLPELTSAEAATWQDAYAKAGELLHRDFDDYFTPIQAGLRTLVPQSARPIPLATSSTHANAFGCVYTTAPADPCQLALTLIHEYQHAKLGLLMDQVTLYEPDPTGRFYAPWRDDPRPIHGLLQGIFAFFGVTDFWRRHRYAACHESLQAHTDFEYWRLRVHGAIAAALSSGLLTDDGVQFLQQLEMGMQPWAEEDVPAGARETAALASIAHRTYWRVRNCSPSEADIAELAASWPGAPSLRLPMTTAVAQQGPLPENYRHLPLLRYLADTGHDGSSPLLLDGDRAYIADDVEKAVQLYEQALQADPIQPQSWAGLALVLPRLQPDINITILHDHPEVVAHTYRMLRTVHPGVDVTAVVRWLARPSRHD